MAFASAARITYKIGVACRFRLAEDQPLEAVPTLRGPRETQARTPVAN